ncbi:MAG: molybdopterin-dependent oxidoreductase [Chloroflexi bacterium]|nr:molybdopterin-dependent oxidoreductase [Chloroflexota bacterium]
MTLGSASLIGRPTPAVDAWDKVIGRAVFGTDVKLPGMIHGKVLRSPHPHARILNIDASRARKLAGVKVVVTGRDIPLPRYGVAGTPIQDETLLAVDKVRYVGDEVAAVAAVDGDTALEALSLIRVEYELLPAVFDPLEAMSLQAPLIHQGAPDNIASRFAYERGEAARAFAQADYIYQGSFATSLVHQAYLEPNAAVAEWDGTGKLTLWLPTQSPAVARLTYSRALGISQDSIRIIQTALGGAFGAKIEVKLHPLCALLAREAGRPVRLVNSREEEFVAGNPRVPMIFNIRLAVRKDGTLLGQEMRVIADCGAYVNYTPAILLSAALRHDNMYRIPNIKTEAYAVYTNKVATGCFRGFGQPQSHFALEQALDEVARELGRDPLELRLKNAAQPGDVTVHGWRLDSCGLTQCLEESARIAGWRQRETSPPMAGRGLGLACCVHVSGNRSFLPFFDGSSAYLQVGEEGRVTVFTGEVDLGQGARTVFAQIAAEVLGVPLSQVEVAPVDTQVSPHGLGTWGDRATTLGGNGVLVAARDARRQILALAAQELEAREEDLECHGGRVFVTGSPEKGLTLGDIARRASYRQGGGLITGRGSYIPQTVTMIHPETKYGNISIAYPFAAQVAEVAVDRETGQVEVLRVAAAHDLGRALNPLAAQGQIQGAIAQGLGFGLMERMIVEEGGVTNPSFADYPLPTACDMPAISVTLVETYDPNGPFGAKGLAEPALIPTAPAIANAIYQAVGVRLREQPMTPEGIWRALKGKGNG